MNSYIYFKGEKLYLIDVKMETDAHGIDQQYGEIQYKDEKYKVLLRFNVYSDTDMDKLPYFIFEGETLYLGDFEDEGFKEH